MSALTVILHPAWFVGVAFGALLFCYAAVVQWRRIGYRRLADALGATYISEGWVRTGRIEGIRNGKRFVLLTNSVRSCLSMATVNRGIPLCLDIPFFQHFPDWRYAHGVGDRFERCFFFHVRRRSVAVPLDTRYRPLVERLTREFAGRFGRVRNDQVSTGTLWIHNRRMDFQCPGILNDLAQIGRILAFMDDMTLRIQFLPVV